MYKSFEIINNFVREIWEFDLIEEPMNHKLTRIEELKNTHRAIMNINHNLRKPFPDEFVKYVYPLLEISVQWAELKKKGELTEGFLERCKQRVKTQSNFYGTIFEIDMASRCLLSDWNVDFVEDYTKEGKQIDFLFHKESKVAGVECLSKRYTKDSLTIDKINIDINKKAKKFKQEYIEKLKIPLNERLLIIDITTAGYSSPKILKELEGTRSSSELGRSSELDAVIFTWREDIIDGKNHSLRVKYKIFGNIDMKYFSVTYASEFHVTNKGSVFFMRKYIEPEPTVEIGPVESVEHYGRR
ncbi:MAG: hypothetical protein PQ975_11855 [Methanobacterium sp.]